MQRLGPLDAWIEQTARRFFATTDAGAIRIVLPSGAGFGPSPEQAAATLRVCDRRALAWLLIDPEVQFGDLYAQGRIQVEGELVAVTRAGLNRTGSGVALAEKLPRRLIEGIFRNDPRQAEASARHHYDVGNEFYRLWLDEQMVYTCAYFPSPDASLEEAQIAKFDHVCRKLALRPGERVIEAGCGWGSLALHMARYYGVTVRAFNVAQEQVAYAQEQAEKQGLQDRVEFILDDYRNATGQCDAFVSVGMLEHVGLDHYADLGAVIDRCMGPNGRGLLHTIGRSQPKRLSRWIRKRVFPHAHPPTLRQMMDVLEPFDLVTLDVENLRLHYALTGRHWLQRYQRAWKQVVEQVGEEQGRVWELYLAGVQGCFELGILQLFQLVFSRANNDRIPWQRGYMYPDADSMEDGFDASKYPNEEA